MPNYDFHCQNPNCPCVQFEQVVPNAITEVPCKECGEPAVRKLSAPAFTVRGGTPKFHK